MATTTTMRILRRPSPNAVPIARSGDPLSSSAGDPDADADASTTSSAPAGSPPSPTVASAAVVASGAVPPSSSGPASPRRDRSLVPVRTDRPKTCPSSPRSPDSDGRHLTDAGARTTARRSRSDRRGAPRRRRLRVVVGTAPSRPRSIRCGRGPVRRWAHTPSRGSDGEPSPRFRWSARPSSAARRSRPRTRSPRRARAAARSRSSASSGSTDPAGAG